MKIETSCLTVVINNAREHSGHGFRIGAATTVVYANLPSWLMKTWEPWAPHYFERHIGKPGETFIDPAQQLINA